MKHEVGDRREGVSQVVTWNPVVFRIQWCRHQRQNAHTKLDQDVWRAEERGLRDALLNRDNTSRYRQASPRVFERYVLGFQDGQALIRVAWINRN